MHMHQLLAGPYQNSVACATLLWYGRQLKRGKPESKGPRKRGTKSARSARLGGKLQQAGVIQPLDLGRVALAEGRVPEGISQFHFQAPVLHFFMGASPLAYRWRILGEGRHVFSQRLREP